MDMLKNAASKMASGSGNNQNQQTGQTGQSGMTGTTGQSTTGQTGQTQDYGDKAFDAISKKAGHDFTPQQDEKITDAACGAYEKYSERLPPH